MLEMGEIKLQYEFSHFNPKGKIIKLIKKMKEKYKRSVDSGKLEFSKGPRYALVSNFSWNSVLSIENHFHRILGPNISNLEHKI